MIVVTTENIANMQIVRTLGLVRGTSVRGRAVGAVRRRSERQFHPFVIGSTRVRLERGPTACQSRRRRIASPWVSR